MKHLSSFSFDLFTPYIQFISLLFYIGPYGTNDWIPVIPLPNVNAWISAVPCIYIIIYV